MLEFFNKRYELNMSEDNQGLLVSHSRLLHFPIEKGNPRERQLACERDVLKRRGICIRGEIAFEMGYTE